MRLIMRRLLLHIGNGKCGSSSIQNFLGTYLSTPEGVTNRAGKKVSYAAVWKSRILSGPDLLAAQNASVSRYVMSAPLEQFSPTIFRQHLRALQNLTEHIDTVVLSCEGWASGPGSEFARVIDEFRIPVDIYFVIRPPVEFTNSAWWQWGAWTGHSIQYWSESVLPLVEYAAVIRRWREVSNLDQICVVDLSHDIRGALIGLMGFSSEDFGPFPHLNRFTGSQLLRNLILYREEYGRTVHNPDPEMRLSDILDLPNDRPPFVIPPTICNYILSQVHGSSEQIIRMMEQAGKVLNIDVARQYLDVEYYADMSFVDYATFLNEPPTQEFVKVLILGLLRLSHKLDNPS